MPNHDEIIQQTSAAEKPEKKTALDYFSLVLATVGVGYLPIAPGTWGSAVGVGIYLLFAWLEKNLAADFFAKGWGAEQLSAWRYSGNLLFLLIFCLLGIWASNRVVKILGRKDPSEIVVDEVMGQLITFLFIPLTFSWQLILAGFLLFRLFDIWKPYPIDSLQSLPAGIGVCADDILAGVYAGVILSLIYAFSV